LIVQTLLLQGELPQCVTVAGKRYSIYTDFRRWIQIEVLLFEEQGSFVSKLPEMLRLCYPILPDTLEEAIHGITEFYSGGSKQKKKSFKGKGQALYSFVQDEALIYAGFYQQYGIDLVKADLHWWQFKALFEGLSEKTLMTQVMQYRAVDISSVKNPEEQRFYRRMKELYRLEDTRTEEEKEAATVSALAQLF